MKSELANYLNAQTEKLKESQRKEREARFSQVVDQTGRISSLEISGDKIEVVGVLPHCSQIEPNSVDDAKKLIQWLEKWVQKKGACLSATHSSARFAGWRECPYCHETL